MHCICIQRVHTHTLSLNTFRRHVMQAIHGILPSYCAQRKPLLCRSPCIKHLNISVHVECIHVGEENKGAVKQTIELLVSDPMRPVLWESRAILCALCPPPSNIFAFALCWIVLSFSLCCFTWNIYQKIILQFANIVLLLSFPCEDDKIPWMRGYFLLSAELLSQFPLFCCKMHPL